MHSDPETRVAETSAALSLSVIIPVCNALPWLEACLQSILGQTLHSFELILVDDGSTDGSGACCDRAAAADARVRVLHQCNAGVSAARNQGLAASHGTAVIFLDADDTVEPEMLQTMLERLETDRTDAAICGYVNERLGSAAAVAPPDGVLAIADLLPRCFDTHAFVPIACNKLFRKAVLRRPDGTWLSFPEGITNGEDFAWTTQALCACSRVSCIARPFYHYYIRQESATDGIRTRLDEKALTELQAYELVLEACRPVSQEALHLATLRYLNRLLIKLKAADLQENAAVQALICPLLQRAAQAFYPQNSRERLTLLKIRLILLLKRLHAGRSLLLFAENRLSLSK